jgi:hypothetical protein
MVSDKASPRITSTKITKMWKTTENLHRRPRAPLLFPNLPPNELPNFRRQVGDSKSREADLGSRRLKTHTKAPCDSAS